MGKRWLVAALLVGLLVGAAGGYLVQAYRSQSGPFHANRVRDLAAQSASGRTWAQREYRPGLPNLYRVSPILYRGAQPQPGGMAALKELGVRTVVNLRTSDTDAAMLAGTGLAYERIPMTAANPERAHVLRFLEIVTDPDRTPVFVHCNHGADRTGLVVAAYRVAVQGWTKDQDIAEMTRGGFGFHLWHADLAEVLRELDTDALGQAVTAPATAPQ